MTVQYNDEEEKRRKERFERRIQEMKRQKKKQERIEKILKKAGIAALLILCICLIIFACKKIFTHTQKEEETTEIESIASNLLENASVEQEAEPVKEPVYAPKRTDATTSPGDVVSNYAILIDLEQNTIVAEKNANERINPASMTKILTVLVAAEQIENFDDSYTIPSEIIDYCFKHDCSNAGFEEGETVTVKDLFYGTILPSGGEAALGLAYYVSGSQEEFVKLMNKKAEELGIGDTAHFTNCMGIYGTEHYCSVYDMAVILKAALQNDFCKEVLSAHTYTTSVTSQHPEGITISNWFLRRIEDKDCGGEVLSAKTGYVVESGNCAASFAKGNNGSSYICVTADANSGWRCIYDHVAIYKKFIEAAGSTEE